MFFNQLGIPRPDFSIVFNYCWYFVVTVREMMQCIYIKMIDSDPFIDTFLARHGVLKCNEKLDVPNKKSGLHHHSWERVHEPFVQRLCGTPFCYWKVRNGRLKIFQSF